MKDPAACRLETSAQELWELALNELQLQVTRPNYETWLKDTIGLRFDNGSFVVGAPNDFATEWLSTKLRPLIAKTLTGIIGHPLPMDRLTEGVRAAHASLCSAAAAARGAERAIMTTDTRPKACAVRADIGGKPFSIGGMAKGAVEYNADAASKAAANLAALSKMGDMRMWPPGSDNASLGDETTAALPAIWAEGSDIGAKAMGLVEAAAAMDSAAGGGLESLQGAMNALGGACGACHKAYRAKDF